MLRDAETANTKLKEEQKAATAQAAEQVEAIEEACSRKIAVEREEHAAALQEAVTRAEAAERRAEELQRTLDTEREARQQAERTAKQLEQEASAASSRYEAAVAEAEQFADAGRRRAEAELDSAKRKFAADAQKAAEEVAARLDKAQGEVAAAKAEAEALRAERDSATEHANERAVAAGAVAEKFREEARRSVGAERQRVAGMLYKEALQTQTLQEQEKQLEDLNMELADARESLRESQQQAQEYAARLERQGEAEAEARVQLSALSAAQAKAVEYIEELDERLAVEQAVIEEQKALIGHLQESLTEKTSKEASSATRLVMTEGALGELKQEARALRVALRQAQTDADEAKAKMPQSGCQTEWQTVHMPLPCLPHGGTWSAGGKKPEVVRERPPAPA